MYICGFCCCFYLILAHITGVIAIRDVFSDAAAKQYRLLRHNTNMRAQPLNVQSAHIVIINGLIKRNKPYYLYNCTEYCNNVLAFVLYLRENHNTNAL